MHTHTTYTHTTHTQTHPLSLGPGAPGLPSGSLYKTGEQGQHQCSLHDGRPGPLEVGSDGGD